LARFLLEGKEIVARPCTTIHPAVEGFPMRKALQLCVVFSVALLLISAAGDQTICGCISCSACGAKGATGSHRDCMEKCFAKGAGVVLVMDGNKSIMRIDNPDAVSGHLAQRVALFGYVKDSAFHVISVRTI
jgi:hypothetical protein